MAGVGDGAPSHHDPHREGAAEIVVIDSIQTCMIPTSVLPGSVAQVRECANRLVTHAKAHGTTVLLVGHVTKEGTLAGPECSSMWSTRCSSSTAIVTTVCGFCVRRSIAWGHH